MYSRETLLCQLKCNLPRKLEELFLEEREWRLYCFAPSCLVAYQATFSPFRCVQVPPTLCLLKVYILLFRCIAGYSEALFSTRCLQDSDCRDYWALPLVAMLALAYAAFLLFQKNLKDFMLAAPLGKRTFRKNIRQWKTKPRIKSQENEENELKWDTPRTEDEKDEGGAFLIILFYYFQDASVVHINTIYVNSHAALADAIKTFVGGIFKFRLDVLHFAKAVCPVSGLTPSVKIVFKLLFVPMVLGILGVIYAMSLSMETRQKASKKWDFLARRSALAIMFAILFSYQKLASSLFTLVNCTTIEGIYVLFVDAEIECYSQGQVVVLLFLVFSICPFSLYIALSPALMKKGYINLGEFFLGCIVPLPMAVYWSIRHCILTSHKVKPTDDAVSVYKLLQGPYREFDLPGILRYTCWAGVLLGRRLCLVLAATFISNVIVRLSVMMAICQLSLLHTVLTRPCKEKRGNIAGIVSSSALLTVCSVNFLRAAYESAEYAPEGFNFTLMKVFDQVENSLLIWIPLAGVVVIVLVLIGRLIARLIFHVIAVQPITEVNPENSTDSRDNNEARKPDHLTPVAQ